MFGFNLFGKPDWAEIVKKNMDLIWEQAEDISKLGNRVNRLETRVENLEDKLND